MTDVRVVEMFGPTFQGEGPNAGRRAVFIRFAACNLDCAWCDTPYSWDWHGRNGTAYDPAAEVTTVPVEDCAAWAAQQMPAGGLVVITGGEPTIQAHAVTDLAERLAGTHEVEVETNGTLTPPLGPYRANVSPKLGSAGVNPARAERPANIAAWAGRKGTAWKFVAQGPADLAAIAEFVERYELNPATVWVMPEGRTAGAHLKHLRDLADLVLGLGYNLTTRLHVLTWGDQRAR